MKDPLRLHDAGTADERRLIALARQDAPPLGAVERTFTTLGVAGVVALAPTAAHATGLGTGAVAASSSASAASSSSVTLLSLAKWLSVGALGGALSAAAATATTWSPRPRTLDTPTVAGPRASRGRPVAREHSQPPETAASNAPTTAPTQAGSPAVSNAADTLAAELALLERARHALAEGRSDEARALLGLHRRRFGAPTLSEEADVLRIEVLLARGELELGEQAARDFLGAHPASPHAERVRTLLPRFRRDPKAVEWPSSP